VLLDPFTAVPAKAAAAIALVAIAAAVLEVVVVAEVDAALPSSVQRWARDLLTIGSTDADVSDADADADADAEARDGAAILAARTGSDEDVDVVSAIAAAR
jgi:hypothetical protein